MVNVHGRTATIQPEQDFNHPPPPSPMAKIHLDAHFPPRGFPKPDRNIRKSYFAFSQGSKMKKKKLETIVFHPKRSNIKLLLESKSCAFFFLK